MTTALLSVLEAETTECLVPFPHSFSWLQNSPPDSYHNIEQLVLGEAVQRSQLSLFSV